MSLRFRGGVDEVFGVKGTPKRDAMEKRLKEEVDAYSFEGKLLGALKEVKDHLSGVKKMASWEDVRNGL
jgi:hypothetical protein